LRSNRWSQHRDSELPTSENQWLNERFYPRCSNVCYSRVPLPRKPGICIPKRHARLNLMVHVKYSPPRAGFHSVRASFVHGPGQQVQLAPLSGPGSNSHSGLIDPCNLFIKVWAIAFPISSDSTNTRFAPEPRPLHHFKCALYPLPSSESSVNVKLGRFLLFLNSTDTSSGRLPCLMRSQDLNTP